MFLLLLLLPPLLHAGPEVIPVNIPTAEGHPHDQTRFRMTMVVPAGQEDCYFIPNITADHVFAFHYKVVDADGPMAGDFRIGCTIYLPNGKPLATWVDAENGLWEETIMDIGDYKVCLDNTAYKISNKHVEVAVLIEERTQEDYYSSEDDVEAEEDRVDEEESSGKEEREGAYFLDFELKELREGKHRIKKIMNVALTEIRKSLGKIRHYVNMIHTKIYPDIRAKKVKDYNMIRRKEFAVNFWSLIHSCGLIIIGLIQLVTVKSLFEERSVVRKVLDKIMS